MVLGLCSCVLVMMSKVWLGSGFGVCFLLEIDYREEHKEHEDVILKKIMKRKNKIKKDKKDI